MIKNFSGSLQGLFLLKDNSVSDPSISSAYLPTTWWFEPTIVFCTVLALFTAEPSPTPPNPTELNSNAEF